MLTLQKVRKEFDHRVILDDITFSLLRGERVGLVAPNGMGKTTLLRLIMGHEVPTAGAIVTQKSISIAYFPQELPDNVSVREYLYGDNIEDEKIERNIHMLQVAGLNVERKIESLSGGERAKIALARIMSSNADIFLLDEPTNNLDFKTLRLFENFISSQKAAFIIISHDRAFLDKTVQKIFEIDEFSHMLHVYNGGYSEYQMERKARAEREWSEYNVAQEKKNRMKRAIDIKSRDSGKIDTELKNRRKLSTKITDKKNKTELMDRAGKISRQGKKIKNRLEASHLDQVEKPKTRIPIKMSLGYEAPSGSKVFVLKGVKKRNGDSLLGPFELSVQFGDRVLIMGDNGVGKTTLVRMLMNEIVPDSGEIERGTQLNIGYLPQITSTDEKDSALSFFRKSAPHKEESDARKILNRLNITSEDVSKKLHELSPGLRSRLILASIVASEANCLVLDEPSNHLDLEALEKLEEELVKYTGTLIIVSHDRRLIEKIGFTKVYALTQDGVLKSIVNVNDYIEGVE